MDDFFLIDLKDRVGHVCDAVAVFLGIERLGRAGWRGVAVVPCYSTSLHMETCSPFLTYFTRFFALSLARSRLSLRCDLATPVPVFVNLLWGCDGEVFLIGRTSFRFCVQLLLLLLLLV